MADLVVKPAQAVQTQATPEQLKRQKEAEVKLKKVCADFESIFTYSLMKSMRKSVPEGGVIPKSSARGNWEMMMDQKIAESVSQKGQGLGLQTVLFEQMKKRLKISEEPPI
jgi:peptidoglycan hydrolase FlgJ